MTNPETAVLACCLLDAEVIPQATEALQPNDFECPKHRQIFQTIAEADGAVDKVTLGEAGCNAELLGEIANYIPSAVPVAEYIELVLKHSRLRKIQALGKTLYAMQDFEKAVEYTEKALTAITENRAEQDETFATALHEFIDEVDRRKAGEIIGLDCGLGIGEIQKGQLIYIAGRTSHGKTSLATQLAGRFALAGKAVGIISLEMTRREIAGRMVAQVADVPYWKYETARLDNNEWLNISQKMGEIGKTKVFINTTTDTAMQIKAHARKWFRKEGIDVLIIDYIQLMQGSGDKRNYVLAEISRELKKLAGELEIPVICLSQLNRDSERENRRPRLSDLRDSGAIEQDADKVIFVYRPNYNKGSNEPEEEAELIVGKNRNGPTGIRNVLFKLESMTFKEQIGESPF